MYSNKKRMTFILLMIILLTSPLLFGGCDKKEESTTDTIKTTLKPQEENYTTIMATKGDYVTTFSSKSVELVYQSETAVTSDKKTSKLKEILVNNFDTVSEGDVIATLDMEVSMVNIEEKQLSLKRSKQNYQTAAKEQEENLKQQELAVSDMVTGAEKDIAEMKLKKVKSQYDQYVFQTENDLKQQEDSIKELQETYSDHTIVAPFDGIIIEISDLEPGDRINTGDTICRMASSEHMLLGVAEQGILRYNMEVTVTSRFGQEETVYTGHVVAAKDVIPETQWRDMSYIALDDPTQYMNLTNTKVDADYVTIKNVLLVDASGVSNDSSKRYVSLFEEDQIKKRYVVIGKSDRDKAWILQGLSENQSVIINEND